MEKKENFALFSECKKYKISLFRCPDFLFLLFGIIILFTILISYFIARAYIEDPRIVFFIVASLTIFLLILAFNITHTFRRLLEISKLTSDVINIFSHHLRSPISNINWALDLLFSGKLGELNESQKEYLESLKKEGERLNEIVSRLLIFSKLEFFGNHIEKKEVSLLKITKEILEKLSPPSKIKVQLESSEDLPKIFTDPKRVKLAIENLISNALYYTNDEIKIKIKKGKNKIYFEVEDNGIGIPEQEKKFIFQKFFRGEKAILRFPTGAGIGLYLTKIVIESLKGKVGFSSVENKGSKFWFYLPIE